MKIRHILALALAALTSGSAAAAEPAGYYDSCKGKGGSNLLTALCSKISSHTNVGYNGLYGVYETSDVHPDGTVWDMYSTKNWGTWSHVTKCGNYSGVGSCINREHSVPQSWFNEASPMKSDAFHVYPTDGKVNGQRSNYPYGECAGGTTLSNGSIKGLGRLGTSTFPGYSGRVFEPTTNTRAISRALISTWPPATTTASRRGVRPRLPATAIPCSHPGPSTSCSNGTVRTP